MVRLKHRYILAEIVFEKNQYVYPLKEDQVYHEIRKAYQDGFGEYGFALVKSSLSVRYLQADTKMLLIKIKRGAEIMLCNVLSTMSSLHGEPMKIITKHISGSIRCAQKYWMKYKRKLITEQIRSRTDAELKAELIEKVKSIAKTDITSIFRSYSMPGKLKSRQRQT